MRSFKVPFKKSYDDKIIGGWLTLRQIFYLAIPVILIGICIGNYSIFTYKSGNTIDLNWVLIFIVLIIWVGILILCLAIAFIKINNLTLDKYITKRIIYKTKRKHIKFYQ